MVEYKYRNDYEREETQKYEGAYTPEEIELNKKLLEECNKKEIDLTAVEDLLKQGADPLGGTAVCGWGLLDHVYGEIVDESQDSESVNLPAITELFLKYGMNVDSPRVPYDGANSLNPLWDLAFVTNENAIIALKMLLDSGLSADSFGRFWGHAADDLSFIECGDPQNDEFWNKTCIWTLKMILLGASYDHIFTEDEDLGKFICYSRNSGNVHMFREWNDFDYAFDTSNCDRYPKFHGSIVHITSKKTGKEVWRIGVGGPAKRKMDELSNRIEIHEGFYPGDNTIILPVKIDKTGRSYEGKTDRQISICCYYLEGFLESLLKKHFSKEIQLEDYKCPTGYEEFGWNFYTPEQIESILSELEEHLSLKAETDQMADFYARFIVRMKKMLNDMDGCNKILFCGP